MDHSHFIYLIYQRLSLELLLDNSFSYFSLHSSTCLDHYSNTSLILIASS